MALVPVAAVAGLFAGGCSLLLRLPPGLTPLPGATIAWLAEAHAPLVLLGCAVPALLGGLGFLLLPASIGAREIACPSVAWGATLLLALSVVLYAAIPMVAGAAGPGFPLWWATRIAVSGFVAAAIGCALPLLATLLNHGDGRTRPAQLLPAALAVGCSLAIGVLPVVLARFWAAAAGTDRPDHLAALLAWPVSMIVLPPAIGLVVDVLAGERSRPATRRAGWALGLGGAVGFQLWCAPLFGHPATPPGLAEAGFLLPVLAVLLSGCVARPRLAPLYAPSGLAAAGFVAVAVVTAVRSLVDGGLPLHYLLSAGVSLALCCGLLLFLERLGLGAMERRIARVQVVALFVGMHLMLLPSPIAVALGAAACGMSLVLLAGLLAVVLLPRRRRVRMAVR